MADIGIVESKIKLPEIERMSPQERIEQQIYTSLINWIKTDFRKEFTSQIARSRDDNAKIRPLCRLMGELGCVLDVFAGDRMAVEKGQISKWNKEIGEVLFNEGNPNSIINCCPKDKQSSKMILSGAISLVTFTDLIRKCGVKVNVWSILAPVEQDIKNAVDLILEIGDNNIYGDEIIRLVQLKVKNVKKVEIHKVDEKALQGDVAGCDSEAAKKLVSAAGSLKKQKARLGKRVDIRPFFVLVPSYTSDSIGNALGIIIDKSVIDDFSFNAEALGLTPSRFSRIL